MSVQAAPDKATWLKSGPPPKNLLVPNGRIGRLVAAAVVDSKLCHLLLTDLPAALSRGYNSQPFELSQAEMELVMSVKSPKSLADFAQQIITKYNQK